MRIRRNRLSRLGPLGFMLCVAGCATPAPRTQPSAESPVATDHLPCLHYRCVRSPHPDRDNAYTDMTDCPPDGGVWTVAVHSETPTKSFGPTSQSFLVNGPNSPVRLAWRRLPRDGTDTRWEAILQTDFDAVAHPAGGGYFTWFVLMQHIAHGGRPLPPPTDLSVRTTVQYSDKTPNGASRGFVGFTAVWDGVSHGIELCFATSRWGDNDEAADIITSLRRERLQFVTMDGAPRGVHVSPDTYATLDVNWTDIVMDLVARGYFDAPTQGWPMAKTAAVYIGTEVNNFSPQRAARAELRVAGFTVSSDTATSSW